MTIIPENNILAPPKPVPAWAMRASIALAAGLGVLIIMVLVGFVVMLSGRASGKQLSSVLPVPVRNEKSGVTLVQNVPDGARVVDIKTEQGRLVVQFEDKDQRPEIWVVNLTDGRVIARFVHRQP